MYQDPHEKDLRFIMHYGDMTDATNLIRIVQETQPHEIYNLAAQSHVQVSFETPEYTANADALGTLRLLEAIRILGIGERVRFYQASTSELYGKVQETPQRETTPFYPRSPYAAAKLYAYWITVNYREAYGMHASNGILFNHEGPTRGETFVTRKITRAVAAIELGKQDKLYLGNLDAKRDWGHARDYRRRHVADPAAGRSPTIMCWRPAKAIRCGSSSNGPLPASAGASNGAARALEEVGVEAGSNRVLVEIDPRYFRPTEVEHLLGDPSKARAEARLAPPGQFRGARRRDGRIPISRRSPRERHRPWRLSDGDEPPAPVRSAPAAASAVCRPSSGMAGSAIVRRLDVRTLRDRHRRPGDGRSDPTKRRPSSAGSRAPNRMRCFWRPPGSAAFTPTAPIRPISSPTISPLSST